MSSKPRSEEHKRNISKALRGIKRTEETKRKMSSSKMGDKNPSWRGGITPLDWEIRKSYLYRQWRSDVFTRDNFTCVLCGDKTGNTIEADHIKSFALILREKQIKNMEQAVNCEELWNINNGRTLCKSCHRKTDTFGSKSIQKII